MTNERHEKALWEASNAYWDTTNDPEGIRDMSKAISAYLQAMDALIVPKEPTDETVSAFMAGKFQDGDDSTLIKSIYRRIVSSAPNHFTNGE